MSKTLKTPPWLKTSKRSSPEAAAVRGNISTSKGNPGPSTESVRDPRPNLYKPVLFPNVSFFKAHVKQAESLTEEAKKVCNFDKYDVKFDQLIESLRQYEKDLFNPPDTLEGDWYLRVTKIISSLRQRIVALVKRKEELLEKKTADSRTKPSKRETAMHRRESSPKSNKLSHEQRRASPQNASHQQKSRPVTAKLSKNDETEISRNGSGRSEFRGQKRQSSMTHTENDEYAHSKRRVHFPRENSHSSTHAHKHSQPYHDSNGQSLPPGRSYSPPRRSRSPIQQFAPPIRRSPPPERHYPSPVHRYPPPERQFPPPERQFPPPERQFPPPERQFPPSERQYPLSERQYPPSERQYPPERQFPSPERRYPSPEQRHQLSERRHQSPEQRFSSPVRQPPSPTRRYRPQTRRSRSPLRRSPLPAHRSSPPMRRFPSHPQQLHSPQRRSPSPTPRLSSPSRRHPPHSRQPPSSSRQPPFPPQRRPSPRSRPSRKPPSPPQQPPSPPPRRFSPVRQFPHSAHRSPSPIRRHVPALRPPSPPRRSALPRDRSPSPDRRYYSRVRQLPSPPRRSPMTTHHATSPTRRFRTHSRHSPSPLRSHSKELTRERPFRPMMELAPLDKVPKEVFNARRKPLATCYFCDHAHWSHLCVKINTLEERRNFYMNHNLCFNCGKDHRGKKCRVTDNLCKWPHCAAVGEHHSALCTEAQYPITFDVVNDYLNYLTRGRKIYFPKTWAK